MPTSSSLEFPPFRLDLSNEELWRGAERLPLRAKPFAVLAYLVRNPGRLVPREELVRAVWPDTHVGEGLLRGYVRELRNVLGDDAEAPRFIETVPRRGYRFVAPVVSGDDRAAGAAGRGAPFQGAPAAVVGRDGELLELAELLADAEAGARRIAFVTGEAGIGKTTLVDAFVAAAAERGVWTARGQCVEHFGSCEAYLPVLEALGSLGRSPHGEDVVRVLGRYAPSWLVELPALVTDPEAVQRRAQGTTRARMLRELADALEVLTSTRALVLVLEDLHWSDPSTLDLLSSLARRRERARLLVVATYRPTDVSHGAHPLAVVKRELQVHDLCTEISLRALDADEVSEVLAARLPEALHSPQLGLSIHAATEGNPLFVVNLADWWVEHGAPGQGFGGVPDSLRQMVERQLDRLPSETRRVLEAASVIGAAFSSAGVAAALEDSEEPLDATCDELAGRELFLRARAGEAAAGAGYEFVHAIYRQVLYDQIPPARRVRLHLRIGEWLESVYGALAPEHAAELALHFEQGREPARALRWLDLAAKNAMRRHACHEAADLLSRALERLAALPAEAGTPARELSLRMAFGTAQLMARGYSAPEVKQAYARAYELSRGLADGPELLFALAGLFRFSLVRAELKLARELSEQVLRVAERTDTGLLGVAHSLAGLPLLSVADFAGARAHFERGLALYDFDRHRTLAFEHGDDPALTALAFLALTLWLTGFPDQALARMREARALAERLGAPYSRAFAQSFSAWIHVRRGEAAETIACCDALAALAAEHGFAFLLSEGAVFRGWALAERGRAEEGIAEIRAGLAGRRAAGAEMGRPTHLALLADACGMADRPEEGVAAVEEGLALVAVTGERTHEAELHRLKGELLAQAGREDEGEACLRHALDVARRQGARSLELRAALGLARLRRRGGRAEHVDRRVLRELLGTFSEGFETADLRAARGLLDASARGA